MVGKTRRGLTVADLSTWVSGQRQEDKVGPRAVRRMKRIEGQLPSGAGTPLSKSQMEEAQEAILSGDGANLHRVLTFRQSGQDKWPGGNKARRDEREPEGGRHGGKGKRKPRIKHYRQM